MKCPICGKELELRNKQIGTNENGDPIFNEYAICRDCKKQWNLDKQRAKRSAAKKAAQEAAGQKESPVKEKAPVREIAAKKLIQKKKLRLRNLLQKRKLRLRNLLQGGSLRPTAPLQLMKPQRKKLSQAQMKPGRDRHRSAVRDRKQKVRKLRQRNLSGRDILKRANLLKTSVTATFHRKKSGTNVKKQPARATKICWKQAPSKRRLFAGKRNSWATMKPVKSAALPLPNLHPQTG